MMISPRITFYGKCGEAIEYYKNIFNIHNIKIETFQDNKDLFGDLLKSEYYDLIYKAELEIQCNDYSSVIVMGDSPTLIFTEIESYRGCQDNITFDIYENNENEIIKLYTNLLKDNGKINIALRKEDTYKLHGSIIDKYGICWIFNCK